MKAQINIPELECSDNRIKAAFLIAVGDILGNIHSYSKGLVEKPELCLMAGLDYPDTWVRDASINISNAGFLLSHKMRKNTLLSCVQRIDGKYRVVHVQPWDCVIWAMGAKSCFFESGDRDFGRLALEILRDTLEYYEETELDEETGLFFGPGVYADGVSGYPDKYGILPSMSSGIARWGTEHPESARGKGLGIPMQTLSTNCAYVYAYETAAELESVLGAAPGEEKAALYLEKARGLRNEINRSFWNPQTGRYDYIKGECDSAEGIGLSFAILWNIADMEKAQSIADNTPMTQQGIACLYPTFERYSRLGGFGRHSGTVWPFINAYWALAMKQIGRAEVFDRELFGLTEKAIRDLQFTEIYHPVTGEPYGGLQEVSIWHEIRPWKSCSRQTWSATGYISMIVDGIFGRQPGPDTVTFRPYLPEGIDEIKLSGYCYGDAELNITVRRNTASSERLPEEITLERGCASQDILLGYGKV